MELLYDIVRYLCMAGIFAFIVLALVVLFRPGE